MYPTPQEKAVIEEAEQMMVDTMARYDPSHDKYHGNYPFQTKPVFLVVGGVWTRNGVRHI
jgi:hypothetical protein